MDEIKETSDALFEHRIKLEMTQKQISERAGISISQYQKFEGGQRNILNASFRTACRVIEALGMNVSEFYHKEYLLGEIKIEHIGGKRYLYRLPRKPVQRGRRARQ